MKAVIMAGGKGTRLKDIAVEIPKPMVLVGKEPILLHQIKSLKESGIIDIIIVIGYLGTKIKEYFGNGEKWSVNITYYEEKEPLGTAGALYYLKEMLKEDFILMYGDIFLDIDFTRMIDFHKKASSSVTVFVHPNSHPYDSDLMIENDNGLIVGLDNKNNIRNYDYKNLVNACIYIFSPEVFDYIKENVKTDLEKDVIISMINDFKEIHSYRSTEYAKDMGTPDRYKGVINDYKNGICNSRNLRNKQKCIFLDRDGTINKLLNHIHHPDQIELLPSVEKAICLINNSEYLCIVITNQPVIARGECTVEELGNIHKRIETLLGNKGAYVNDLYYCPHHPDKGFEGEVKELKINCNCRKPNIDLFLVAKEKYNIDFNKSYMIGDSTIDIKAGQNAGLQTILLETGDAGLDHKYEVSPDMQAKNLYEAVKFILMKGNK